VVAMIEIEDEENMTTDEVVAIVIDQDHNTMIGDEMEAVMVGHTFFCIIYSNLFQVVAVEVAEVAVGVTVVADGAEEEAAAVDEADLVASVIVLSPLIGIDWTAPDDVKLKRQKQ